MSVELFKNYTQAIANSDWDAVSNMYAEDCVSIDPDGTLNEGRAANLENDQKWGSMMSDFNYTNSVESGNSTVVEMEVTATMTGEMPMPDGSSIPPSGKTNTFKACIIIDWNNRQIKNREFMPILCILWQVLE